MVEGSKLTKSHWAEGGKAEIQRQTDTVMFEDSRDERTNLVRAFQVCRIELGSKGECS